MNLFSKILASIAIFCFGCLPLAVVLGGAVPAVVLSLGFFTFIVLVLFLIWDY